MTTKTICKRLLASGSALQALAVLGAGVATTTVAIAPAHAQNYTTGTLVGSVRSDTGEVLTEGAVEVTSNEQGFTRTAVVGSDGTFRVPQLPNGTYTVTVSSPGHNTITDSAVRIVAGSSDTFVFSLPAATGAEIVVLGTAIRTNDFAANTTGLVVDVEDLVKTVPVNRDLTSLILLAPATVEGDNGFGNVASISGATVAENAYYVNGLNITDFRDFIAPSTVPFEFYKTVDVKTGGLTAEYGRALGGVTSAVVKSGSNDFQGGVVVSWEPDFVKSVAPDTYAARNSDDFSTSVDANIYLSGPIIKDRLFFYGLFSPQYAKSENTSFTSFARIVSETDSPFYGGKLDAIIADGHRLEAMYFHDEQTNDFTYYRFNSETTGTIDTSPEGAFTTVTGGDSYIFSYTGNFTPWFTLSASWGRNERQGRQFSDGAPYVGTTRYPDPETGNPSSARARGTVTGDISDMDRREQFRVDADFYFTLAGEHHLRAGFDQEHLTAGEHTFYNSGYRYYFYSSYIRRYYYANDGEFKTRYRAFYIQDSWSMFDDRLNLQLGIRNDSFQNKNQEGDVYFEQNDQWGPRLGATFDLFGDRATKLEAYWGRYFLPVATNTNVRAAGSETYYQQRFAYAPGVSGSVVDEYGVPIGQMFNSDGSPVLGASLYSRSCPAGAPDVGNCYLTTSDGTLHTTESTVAQGLKPSYSDEWIIGISHQMDDWKFGLRYINRRLGRTLEDVAIDRYVLEYCLDNGIADCSSYYSGFGQYTIINPGDHVKVAPYDDMGGQLPEYFEFDSAAIGYTKPVRKFDSIQFTFDRPFDGKWSFGGSYTYTDLRGNYEGAVISNINQTDSGLTQDYDQPGFLEGAYGDLANGRKHAIKLYGSYSPFEDFLIGFNFQAYSPRQFSCLGDYDPDGDYSPSDPNSPFGFDPEF